MLCHDILSESDGPIPIGQAEKVRALDSRMRFEQGPISFEDKRMLPYLPGLWQVGRWNPIRAWIRSRTE